MLDENNQKQERQSSSLAQNEESILLMLAQNAQERTGAETAVVALAEDEGTNVSYAEAVGKLADWIRGRRGAAATSGLCGVTFQGYSPVLVCDTRGDSRVRQDHVTALGITTALGAPLYSEGTLLGTLLLFNKIDGSQFNESDEKVLAIYAHEAAPQVVQYLQQRQGEQTST